MENLKTDLTNLLVNFKLNDRGFYQIGNSKSIFPFLDKIQKRTNYISGPLTSQERLYHILNDLYEIPKCKICNRPLKKFSFNKGYSDMCSKKCPGFVMKRINTCQEKYGVDHYTQTSEFLDNFKEKSLMKFGTTHPSKSLEIKEKIKKTCQEKYGTDCPAQNLEIQEKIKNTCLERYNQPISINYKKSKETCQEKYGVDHFTNREQAKQTSFNKYGNKHYNNRYKSKETCQEKYGVDNFMQVPEFFEKCNKYRFKKYIMPSGKTIKVQGYEPKALDELLLTHNEDDILTQRKDIPAIWYFTPDGKKHRYFADFYIPSENLIIEVKSTYTYERFKDINVLKEQATVKLGYNFKFIIY